MRTRLTLRTRLLTGSTRRLFLALALVVVLPPSISPAQNPPPPAGSRQLTRPATGSQALDVVLKNASLDTVLDLFAKAANRTLLRWPKLPTETYTLDLKTLDPAAAVRALEQALREKKIVLVPDGEKFMLVVPAAEAQKVKPRAPQSKAATGTLPPSEALPPGMIDFVNAELSQVAPIYAELAGRKLDPGGVLPSGERTAPRSHTPVPASEWLREQNQRAGRITFRSQNSLSRLECLYALDVLLEWRGFKMVRVGENAMQLAPLGRSDQGSERRGE